MKKHFILHLLLLTVFFSVAQTDPDNNSLEGNWLVIYDGLVQQGRNYNATLTISRAQEWYCQKQENGRCLYKSRIKAGSHYNLWGRYGEHFNRVLHSRKFEHIPNSKTHSYSLSFMGPQNKYIGVKSIVENGHSDVRSATWRNGERMGNETWIRSKASISEISFKSIEPHEENEKKVGIYFPQKINLTYSKMSWPSTSYLQANRPYFYINLYGTNLWGTHSAEFTGNSYDLEIIKMNQIKDESKKYPDNIIGLTLKVVIWPGVTPGEKSFIFDGKEVKFTMEIDNFPDLTVYEEIRLPKLPADGIIIEKGVVEGDKQYEQLEKCNCDLISLARVTYRKYMGMEGNPVWGDTLGSFFGKKYKRTFDTKVVFERNKIYKPDKPARFEFPEEITHASMICFYFTFPDSLAVMQDADKNHLCDVRVKITYPYSGTRGGVNEKIARLYDFIGLAGTTSGFINKIGGESLGQIGTRNMICIPVIDKVHKITKGKGKVEWSIQRIPCNNTVEFEVK